MAPTRVGKDGDDLMKFLEEEISNDDDDDDATEIILEGRQITTIYCGSLLGPVHVVGGSKAVDALGGTPAPEAFLPRNRRTVSDSVACDKDGVPYPMTDSNKERFDPRLCIERGVKESMRYLDKKQLRSILDAVLRVRGERLHRRMTTTDSHRTSEVDTNMDDATNPRAAAGDVTAAADEVFRDGGSPREKRYLFGDDYDDDDDVRGKRTKLSAGGASEDTHPPDDRKSVDEGSTDMLCTI